MNPSADPASPTTAVLTVHFIDAGQGDAILIQTPQGENLLIDAGSNDSEPVVLDYLRSSGVKELAAVVGTHPHEDHIGSMDAVINKFKVNQVYLPRITGNTMTYRNLLAAAKNQGITIQTARAGAIIPLKNVKCQFLGPCADRYENMNDYSAVLRVDYGSLSFLFMGDAGTEAENQMMAQGMNLRAAVLKVGHHGSSSGTGESFLQAVSPRYAVISCGKDNPYGHPHAETLAKLRQAGVEIYTTPQHGSIIIKANGGPEPEITCLKSQQTAGRNDNAGNN